MWLNRHVPMLKFFCLILVEWQLLLNRVLLGFSLDRLRLIGTKTPELKQLARYRNSMTPESLTGHFPTTIMVTAVVYVKNP